MTAPSPHLVFSQPRLTGSPAHLVFGETDAPAPVTVLIAATLPGAVTVAALAAVPVRAEAYVRLSGAVTVAAAALYDNRVTPWLDRRAAMAHQVAAPGRIELGSNWGISLAKRDSTAHGWQTGKQAGAQLSVTTRPAAPIRSRLEAPWQRGLQVQRHLAAVHQAALRHERARAARWQLADRRQVQTAARLQTGIFRELGHAAGWQAAVSRVRDLTALMGASSHRTGAQASARWQTAGAPRNGRSSLPVVVPPIIYPRDGHLVFECPPLRGSPAHLVFGPCACYLPPRAHVVVPLLRTYVTINSIALRRVDGDVAIPTYAFQMSLDVDSWTWSWSASVPLAALPLVQPGSSGEPVEVEALVNGIPYRLLAEGVASQRQFAQARIAVKGRGKAAMLDAPYAPVLNFGNAEARTAQQLMTDVLTVNGVGIGWAVDWDLTDWLVPGNTWTNQGAYIGAILDIAKAAGGYVQPHDTDQTLRVLHRYPAAPWEWGDVTPDFELPSSVVSVEGIDWTRKADYSRVYVSGANNGVLGQVTRAGTAGDSVAPMVTDLLITHADAARQRGLAILSDTGNQARVTLTLPVLLDTGLIKPGQFVRYVQGSQTRLGLVRSTSLAWSRPKLRQTIAVETHV